MPISRRDALKSLGAAAAVPLVEVRGLRLQPQALDRETLAAIAEVVLPAEADHARAVAAFTAWIDGYREGADTDHGYGNTRLRTTGPSPAGKYPAQLAALDEAARARGAAGFAAAPQADRRAVIEAAVAAAKVDRLPGRPNGAHVATDLMGHYFNSADAADLCYRARIARDDCRGLAGSEDRPAPLTAARRRGNLP